MDGYEKIEMLAEVRDHCDYIRKMPDDVDIGLTNYQGAVLRFARTFWGKPGERLCRHNSHLFMEDPDEGLG